MNPILAETRRPEDPVKFRKSRYQSAKFRDFVALAASSYCFRPCVVLIIAVFYLQHEIYTRKPQIQAN